MRCIRFLILTLIVIMAATGCGQKVKVPTGKPSTFLTSGDVRIDADRAWNAQDWDRSELYYERLLERKDLKRDDRAQALERYARSAYNAGRMENALSGLRRWGKELPKAKDTWAWNELYLSALLETDNLDDYEARLRVLLGRTALKWDVRSKAGLQLAWFLWDREGFVPAADVLSKLYKQTPDADKRTALEASILEVLQREPEDKIEDAAAVIPASSETTFPWSLIGFEDAWRKAKDSRDAWPASWQIMNGVVSNGKLGIAPELKQILTSMEEEYGIPRIGVALCLPLSGRHGSIGWRILRGTGVAQWQFAKTGFDIEVKVLNTEEKGWIEKLKALPSYFSVVGGPVRGKDFMEMTKAEVYEDRAVFAFLKSLGELDEGEDAWRFYFSLEDQVRTLVSFGVHQLGITEMATLYPEEKYGLRMSELFWNELKDQGGTLTGIEAYDPKQPPVWGQSVAKLLQVPPKSDNGTIEFAPDPDFGAVFMPDGWSQAQLLAPQFFFYEEDRLLLMGPELWSQAIASGKKVEGQYFRLAICPGSWWDGGNTPGITSLRQGLDEMGLPKADFWTALGYDFLRFAARLGALPRGVDDDVINERAQEAQNITWSMAPLSWDEDGVAHQSMYLFQPTSRGLSLVDVERLRTRLEDTRTKHEERVKNILEKQQAEQEQKALEDGVQVNALQPVAQ